MEAAALPEKNLLQTRPTWTVAYSGLVVAFIISLLVGITVGIKVQRPGVAMAVFVFLAAALGIFVILYTWVHRVGNILVITDRRTILKQGILSRRISEVRHVDIRSVGISQGIVERILDIGTVRIASAGHAGIEIQITGVPSPDGIRGVLDRCR